MDNKRFAIRQFSGVCLGALVLGAGLAPLPLYAQSEPDASATNVPGVTPGVEDAPTTSTRRYSDDTIIVTARKREEALENVPVAVTAFGAEELREKSIRTAYDLVSNTPGLQIRGSSASRNSPEYFIRGQGSSFGTNPGVVVYFAESTLGPVGSSSFFDLESVQVLKGPQGTLFGRSTTGGAVLFTPRRPDDELGGYVEATVGNLAYREVSAAANLPLLDDAVSIRVAFKSEQRDGYTRSLSTDQLLDGRDRQSFRIGLLLKPTDWIESYTLFQEDRLDETPGSNVLINYDRNAPLLNTSPTGTGFLTIQGICSLGPPSEFSDCVSTRVGRVDELRAGYAAEFARLQAGGDDAVRFTPTGVAGAADRETARSQFLVNNTVIELGELGFLGEVSLKNVFATNNPIYNTSIRSIGATRFANGRNVNGLDFVNGVFVPTQYDTDWFDAYTEEFQVSGSIPDTLDWLVGYYLSRSTSDIGLSPYFAAYNNAYNSVGLPIAQIDRPAPIGNYSANSKSWEKGYFAQATLDLSSWVVDGLHLTGGFRKTKSFNDSDILAATFVPNEFGGTYVPGAEITPANDDPFRESANSYTLTADWQINPDWLVYLAHRKGFKPGGVNGIARTRPDLQGVLFQFGPETVKDFEFGTKAQWRIGTVEGRTNFAAYYQDYKGLQRTQQFADPNPPFSTFTQTNNIGAAEIKGFEIENQFRMTDSLTLSANYSYIDAEYTEYPGTTTDILGNVRLNIDTPYTGTPKHQVSAEARYQLPVPEDLGEIFGSVQFYHQSTVALDDSALINPNFSEGFSEPYSLVHARLDWNNIHGLPIDASLFVRNLTNHTHLVAVANFLNAIGILNGIYDEPRTYGLQVRVRFGADGN